MSITLVTSIREHEHEDRVIAILNAHGFSLRFRALSNDDLTRFLEEASLEERILVVLDEGMSTQNGWQKFLRNRNVALLDFSRKFLDSDENLLRAAHDALRKPEALKHRKSTAKTHHNWICVTGASGSPGMTTIALNLASELSRTREVFLIDANRSHQDLHSLVGSRREGRSNLTSSLSFMGMVAPNDRTLLDREADLPFILEIGEMPPIHERLLVDRREETRNFLEILLQSARVVYVTHPNNRAMLELEEFLSFASRELISQDLYVIINRVGNSSRHKAMCKSFKNLIENRPLFVVPRDYALLDRAQGRFAVLSEIAPRSPVRRAIQEVSIYLDKSF